MEGRVRPTLLDRWSRTSNEVLLVKVLENMKSPNVSAVRQSSDSIERVHTGRTTLYTKSEKMLSFPDNASEGYEETPGGLRELHPGSGDSRLPLRTHILRPTDLNYHLQH